MPPRPARPQLGLFDNPVRVFSLEELAETVRALERKQPGRTADELSRAVFAELAMKRTRRAAELVAEAIRVARAREPRAEITGSRWQASTREVRNWALSAGFELGSNGSIPGSPRASAATDPCSDPLLRSASVQSTLQVKVGGVDWPSITSIMRITVPEGWRGTKGLFGDKQHQGASLRCFMPIDQLDYQSAPPSITIVPKTRSAVAMVDISNTITMNDGPEAGSSWYEGLWLVKKRTWGYRVTFNPARIPAAAVHGLWTVGLDAPGLDVGAPTRLFTTYKQGTLRWSLPASQQRLLKQKQNLSKQRVQLPKQLQLRSHQRQRLSQHLQQRSQHLRQLLSQQRRQLFHRLEQLSQQLHVRTIAVSITSPWQGRMNLATDRWPMRWFSDTSWTLGDGVLFDIIALWIGFRLLRRRRGSPEQRCLPAALIGITFISIACYLGYVIDDYLWHHLDKNVAWRYENLSLVAVAAFYFLMALGTRVSWAAVRSRLLAWALVVSLTVVFVYSLPAPVSYVYDYVGAPTTESLIGLGVLMTPLLLAIVLTVTGTVLWISRIWPFGAKAQLWQGQIRELNSTPFSGGRLIMLVLGVSFFGVLVLGQSAAASYYFWLHSDLWGQSSGAFSNVATNLMYDVHWWIGDGIQWPLAYAIAGGILAALWALSADARGVFFSARAASDRQERGANLASAEPGDRRDLALMAAIATILFVGVWDFYDGLSIPLSFIIAFAGFTAWGLTRKLSRLDWKMTRETRSSTDQSYLVSHREDLFKASQRLSTMPKTGKGRAASALKDSDSGQSRQIGQPLPAELTEKVDPGVTALALGPADTWWDNGVKAVLMGRYLIVVPLTFDIYVLWTNGSLSQLTYPFGLQDALGYIISTVLGWLIGLFMFGLLIPYLKGIRTPIKGAVFGLVAFATYVADAAIRHVLGVAPYPTFITDGLLAVALFATLGLLLDIDALRNHNNEGLISSIYRLGSVRVAVTYATTLIIVGVGVWQTFYIEGQTAQQRSQTIANTAQYVDSKSGTGAP